MRLTVAIRHARESAGLTRKALAAASGVPMSTLAKIEQSRSTDPGFLAVVALAEALGLDLASLAAFVQGDPVRLPAALNSGPVSGSEVQLPRRPSRTARRSPD